MPLSTIIGHGSVRGVLRQAVGRGRVPQSLLLAGPDGVGKRAVALALAQAVNCPVRRASQGDDACGACPTCLRIARGSHSDVVSLDRGDDAVIRIKTLRERVLDVVGYRPFEAARRVFIIAADDLRGEAQDALLKTLEEPPPSAILILIAAYPDALLPTVLSRCRRLRFAPLSEEDVTRVLVERVGIAAAEARVLAAASGGSVSRAVSERTGDLAADREAALAVLASAGRGIAAQLAASTALAKNESDRRDREALAARLDVMRSLVRDLAVLAARGGAALANADLERPLRASSAAFDLSRVARAYRTLARADAALERNAGPKIVADWVATRL